MARARCIPRAARHQAGRLFLLFAVVMGTVASVVRAEERAPASTAYVTNQIGNSLSVVDLAAGKQIVEIAIGGKPAGIAVSFDKTRVFVASPESHEIIVVDTATNAVTTRASVGKGPLGIAVNPKSGVVYVADWYEHRLYALDPTTLAITATVATGLSPSGVAVAADGATIFTADRDSNQVSVIDASSFEILATLPTGERPFGITLDEPAARAYTANVAANTISVIDLKTRTRIRDVVVGLRPYAVARAGDRLFVTNQHGESLSVIDAESLEPVATIRVGAFPEGIEADPSGRTIWVACWDANTLEQIDVATLKVAARIAVGDGPRAFGKFLR